jgi:hypothetical protein
MASMLVVPPPGSIEPSISVDCPLAAFFFARRFVDAMLAKPSIQLLSARQEIYVQ